MGLSILKRLFGGGDAPESEKGAVLIVDDEEQYRELIALHLGNCGYQPNKATSVQEARDLIEDGLDPAVVILDVMLGGEDGVSFAKSLRGQFQTAKVPIVFVTNAFPLSQLGKLQDSISNCRALSKPVSAKALMAAIDELEPAPKRHRRKNKDSGRLPRIGSRIR